MSEKELLERKEKDPRLEVVYQKVEFMSLDERKVLIKKLKFIIIIILMRQRQLLKQGNFRSKIILQLLEA